MRYFYFQGAQLKRLKRRRGIYSYELTHSTGNTYTRITYTWYLVHIMGQRSKNPQKIPKRAHSDRKTSEPSESFFCA